MATSATASKKSVTAPAKKKPQKNTPEERLRKIVEFASAARKNFFLFLVSLLNDFSNMSSSSMLDNVALTYVEKWLHKSAQGDQPHIETLHDVITEWQGAMSDKSNQELLKKGDFNAICDRIKFLQQLQLKGKIDCLTEEHRKKLIQNLHNLTTFSTKYCKYVPTVVHWRMLPLLDANEIITCAKKEVVSAPAPKTETKQETKQQETKRDLNDMSDAAIDQEIAEFEKTGQTATSKLLRMIKTFPMSIRLKMQSALTTDAKGNMVAPDFAKIFSIMTEMSEEEAAQMQNMEGTIMDLMNSFSDSEQQDVKSMFSQLAPSAGPGVTPSADMMNMMTMLTELGGGGDDDETAGPLTTEHKRQSKFRSSVSKSS